MRRLFSLIAAGVGVSLLIGCGDDDEAAPTPPPTTPATGSNGAVIRDAPLPERQMIPRSKTLDDPDLPFTVRYPPYLMEGREAAEAALGVAGSLVLDRQNGIIISDFGAPLPPDSLGSALAGKLPEDGQPLRRHETQPALFSIDVRPGDVEDAQIAGQRVSARRYWFTVGQSSWEISCQHTPEFRGAMIAACDQLASTIDPV